MRRHALPPPVVGQQVDELVGRLDRVRADAEGAGEDVGRPARNHADRGRAGAGPADLHDPVDHFVHRSVAAVDDQHVDAVAGGVAADLDGVATVVGVHDGQLDPALQRVGQQIARWPVLSTSHWDSRSARRARAESLWEAMAPTATTGYVVDRQ